MKNALFVLNYLIVDTSVFSDTLICYMAKKMEN